MILVDQLTALIVFVASAILISIGAYGLTASQNLIRQLLSVEVMFNGLIMLVVALLSGSPVMDTYFSIIVISVVSVEVIVVVSIIVAFLRSYRSLSSRDLEEAGV